MKGKIILISALIGSAISCVNNPNTAEKILVQNNTNFYL
jgi:hypothetical protein